MLNSLSGEKFRIDGVLPLACEFQTELIILALDDKGIPKTSEGRLDIVRRLLEMTRSGGLPDEKLLHRSSGDGYFNGNGERERYVGDVPQDIWKEFPKVHLTCGLVQHLFRNAAPLNS